MIKKMKISLVLVVLLGISLVFVTNVAKSQDEESSATQPSYINELIDSSQLSQNQVNEMRRNGQSWGNIRLNVRMAERIAANNSDPGQTPEQKYQLALNQVVQERAAGKGIGDIANEHNMRLGDIIGNGNGNGTQNQQRNQTQTRLENQDGEGTKAQVQNRNQEQAQTQQQSQTKAKKKGLFGRFLGIFGVGKKSQTQTASKEANTKNASTKAQKQQNSSDKSQAQGSSNKNQTQNSVSNKTQTQNSSSSQQIKTQQRTQTTQGTQQGTGQSGNAFRNQGAGSSRGGGGGGGRGRNW